jgi:hypothetical protein
MAPSQNRSPTSADGRVATQPAWPKAKDMEGLTCRGLLSVVRGKSLRSAARDLRRPVLAKRSGAHLESACLVTVPTKSGQVISETTLRRQQEYSRDDVALKAAYR